MRLPSEALDSHHVDPSKKRFDLSKGSRKYSILSVVQELLKCEILCPTCHRLHHSKNIQYENTLQKWIAFKRKSGKLK